MPFVNNGTINATTTDSKYADHLQFGADLANTGVINATLGNAGFDGTSPMLVNNTGAVNVAARRFGRNERRRRLGLYQRTQWHLANQGTTTLSSGMHWIQNGGTETGNPVQMTGGKRSRTVPGPAPLETIDGCGGGTLTGTIPQGQTITVQGATQNCSGNTGQLLCEWGSAAAPARPSSTTARSC